jgi:hypothetical protein
MKTSLKAMAVKRILIALALMSGILISVPSSASAVGYANCVSITGAEIEKKYGDLVYTITLEDVCELGIRYYSLTLKSNKFSVSNVSKSNVIIYSYGNDVSFSLSKFSPGSYSPSLEISSSQDFERRTVSLPRFTIESPVDCLQVTQSGLDYNQSSYSVTLKNICESLDSFAFQDIQIELQGNGLYGLYTNSQKLYSVSDYGSSFKFNLYGLANGTYFPTLRVRDIGNGANGELDLSSFTIKSTESQLPSKSTSSSKRLCVTGKNYVKECFTYPDFSYSICSSSPSGKVQYQSGSKWFFGWNFKGAKDLERCESTYPYLISITGTTKSSVNMRLQFNKFQNTSSFYSNFKVSVS